MAAITDPANRRLWLFAALMVLIILLGGSSRTDVVNGLIVQCIAIAAVTAGLVRRTVHFSVPGSMISWLFLGFCLLIFIQLIQLPYGVWTALPGRTLFTDINNSAQLGHVWRPISLVPDATLNALLAMVVPLAALVLFPLVRRDQWPVLGAIVLGLILLSCTIGLVQSASGNQSFYFFNNDNEPTPNGFFANRNHQALFLAMVPPLAAAVSPFLRGNKKTRTVVDLAALGLILIAGATVLASGSRIGFLAFGFSLTASLLMWWWTPEGDRAGPQLSALPRWTRHWAVRVSAIAILLVGMVLLARLSRDLAAVERLGASTVDNEGRIALIGPLLDLAKIYLPAGTGFGTFAPVYQIHEPGDQLTLSYLNHAHNEAIEILIEGGIVAALLALVFLAAVSWRTLSLWKTGRQPLTRRLAFGRAASIMVVTLLIGCTTDYPLRTPALAFLFVMALGWLWHSADANGTP